MCIAWLLSLFGCGKKWPHLLDGPGMERQIWSAFTIARCNEKFEPIYSYTVTYDADTDEAYLCGEQEKDDIRLRQETVSELFNLDLMSLPDEGAVSGNFLGLTVFDSMGKARPKRISDAKEEEILALLAPYLEEGENGGEEKPTMLDGPSMEYQSPWTAFALSRSDSNTRYCFWFEVTETDEGAVVTGSCQDEDGRDYEAETGIPISAEDLRELRWMDFDQLPDEEPWPEDLEMPLDMERIQMTLTLSDGTVEKKDASSNLSIEIYKLLLPYLKNHQE